MCLECDGYSHEQAMQVLDLKIRAYGWALIQVQDDAMSWSYTVGLVENYGHPELVILDVDLAVGARLLTDLATAVMSNRTISAGVLGSIGARCVDVHDDHLRGDLFARWENRYGELPRQGEVVQVLLPDAAYCACHAPLVRRLDLPGPLPPVPRASNRAQRRRRSGSGRTG